MGIAKTEYYFSTVVLFLGTVFILGVSSGLLFIFLKTYKETLLSATILLLPLIVIFFALPTYLRFMYFAIRRQPALILNKESLINNANGKVYKWSKIESISWEPHTGFKAPPGGYILVKLRDSESTFKIPQNSIKCKTEQLLQDLIRYHKAYS